MISSFFLPSFTFWFLLVHACTCRFLARLIWLASILVFIVGNITFYILIRRHQDEQNDLLIWLRVILLDGLFFVMGILLGLCIILVWLNVNVHTCNTVYRETSRERNLVQISWFDILITWALCTLLSSVAATTVCESSYYYNNLWKFSSSKVRHKYSFFAVNNHYPTWPNFVSACVTHHNILRVLAVDELVNCLDKNIFPMLINYYFS